MAAAYCPSSKNIQMTVPDDEFSCPLCCEIFEEPKLLSNCAHSFCKKCLRELVLHTFTSSHVSCPICRKISNVPENGADGFATNTLLVRLIDNILGKKEKDQVLKALARCKEETEKNKDFQDELENRIYKKIYKNKENRGKLKREIAQHANDAIDSIRKCEQKLFKLVDDSFERNCGLAFHEDLEKHRKTRQKHLDLASACVKTVEETLERTDDLEEIMGMKKMMVEQLNEYSTLPPCPSLSEVDQVKDFNMKFKKFEIKEDILGEVEETIEEPKKEQCTLVQERINCDSNDSTCTLQVITSAPLPFEPFSMAVCPSTGQIALLWEEKSKVYIYSQQGHHKSTISIKYGDLWDVGFTTEDEVVVVNRLCNRLLFYEKDGIFIQRDVKPPRDNLKFTYVSNDDEGRLIVISTRSRVDDNEKIIPCVIVYNNGCVVSCKMFGRRHLVQPISRAIYKKGKFYIVDKRHDQIYIQCFTSKGQACVNCPLVSDDVDSFDEFVSLCTVNNSDKVFLCHEESDDGFVRVLEDGDITLTRKLHCSDFDIDFNKAEVISADSQVFTLVESTCCENNFIRIVKYSLNDID